MPTPRFHILLTFITLVALAASCSPQMPRSLDPVSPADSPSAQVPVQSTVEELTSQPTKPPAANQKPPRGTKAPAGGQGSDASQNNLSFETPAHALDVILGRPTTNSITLSILSATGQTVSIIYGTESGNYTSQTDPIALPANTPHEITLANLDPDTQYFYSISGVENSFHTARAPGSSFIFTIQADSHLDSNTSPQVYLQTLSNERADRPDFAIDLGDTFMTDKYKPYTNARPQYLAQRYFLSQLGQAAPLFLVLGNHDGEGAPRGPVNDMSTWSAQLRTQYFPNPVPDDFYTGNTTPDPTVGALQDYYAWEWGNALFIVLDPYWFTPPQKGNTIDLWNPTLGEAQYCWLKTALETSDAKWKFVFIHQLIGGYDKNGRGGVEVANFYEWGGNNADGSYGFDAQRPGEVVPGLAGGWGVPIHQLLVQNHVTAVFHGHDHLFVKQELDGIIYQECPQPGNARPGNTDSAAEYGYLSGHVLGGPGHLRVNVTPEQVTVEYIRAYLDRPAELAFTFTIPAMK